MATIPTQPNTQYNPNELPGFKEKIYPGIPTKGFAKNDWLKIRASLGNISQDGATMLDTLDQKDPGAGAGTPGGAGTAAQQAQHAARERRLYAIILKITDPLCHLHTTLSTEYVDQGRLAALHFRDENNEPLSQDDLDMLQTTWSEASIVTLKITIDKTCIFKFYNWVKDKALDFVPPKSNANQYMKVLKGCPDQMWQHVSNEIDRMLQAPIAPTFAIPAVYPATHPQAGNAHPNAGEPDTLALVKSLTKKLTTMIERGMIRTKDVSEINDDTDDELLWVRKDGKKPFKKDGKYYGKDRAGKDVELTSKSRCYRCGGLGHYAITNGQPCLTTIKIGREILDKIQYPHIENARPAKNLTVNEVSDSEEEKDDAEVEALSDVSDDEDVHAISKETNANECTYNKDGEIIKYMYAPFTKWISKSQWDKLWEEFKVGKLSGTKFVPQYGKCMHKDEWDAKWNYGGKAVNHLADDGASNASDQDPFGDGNLDFYDF